MIKLIFITLFLMLPSAVNAAEKKPNFIIIFTDDQGYNDLGCFGSKTILTPNIDRLASEGRKFTNFLVASSVCSPSRAALLTGCYPKRVAMHQHVLFPTSNKGLNPEEVTIADHLRANGYATACIGKWHLGHHPETLPRQQGFDSYFGIPYSNDMNHPDNKGKPRGTSSDQLWLDQESAVKLWNTPLMENEKIIELPVDQRTITRRYTDRAIKFVEENKDKPFFLYLPHSMPHIPLYVPEDVYDKDPKNAYKCVIEHIDAEVGRLIETLRKNNLAENTYVIFTSDNGPWLQFKNHGGSALPLRGGKMTTFEGGQRVPCVMWAPGKIPAGTVCDQVLSTMDLLPTIAKLAGTELDTKGNKIDGLDATVILTGDASSASPRKEFIYYSARGNVEGLRSGKWKLLLIGSGAKGKNKKPQKESVMLFDLLSDISEEKNLAEANPQILSELTKRMKELDAEITKNARLPWVKK
jgi:arylsulfatase A-like enzyme